ncbi:MAG: hypothetical protein LBH11_03340 [Propionibacteriaceae bacterium]|nr:hypothetical protein [Propionibacteriaceae bacterium]
MENTIPETGSDSTETSATFAPPASQEALDKLIKERLAQQARNRFGDYDELKAKATKFDKLEDAKKSEIERFASQLATITAERDALKAAQELAGIKAEVAAEKGVSADLLRGSTRDELESHAEAIAKAIAEGAPKQRRGGSVDPRDALKTPGTSQSGAKGDSPAAAAIRALYKKP